MGKYSEQDNQDIIKLYNEGLSQRQVAAKVGCSPSYVKTTLRDNGVPQRNKMFYARQFDDATEDRIVQDYLDGMSIRDLAKKYYCSTMPIVSLFKRRGLVFRDQSHARREYSINENYFDEIDTPNKAYILGFLYADGGNQSNYEHGHYIITLTIHPKDIAILERMREEMDMESPIFTHYLKETDTNYVQIRICNKHMVLRLHELGIVPRKTFKVEFPDWMREDLIPHFIRGEFDGDGSISCDLAYTNIVGHEPFCMRIVDILKEKFGFVARVYPKIESPGICTMVISRAAYKIPYLDWIYKDADLKLDRKYQLYLAMKEKYNYLVA